MSVLVVIILHHHYFKVTSHHTKRNNASDDDAVRDAQIYSKQYKQPHRRILARLKGYSPLYCEVVCSTRVSSSVHFLKLMDSITVARHRLEDIYY